jgi:serine/threonine-protein kinase
VTPDPRIAGRYVVEAPLGKGAMGEVLRARDVRLDRSVALKVLPSDRVGDGHARARLLREARSAAALDHPNIVHVYDVGEAEDGAAFIAMELVRGRTLRAIVADGPMGAPVVARVVEEVASALGALTARASSIETSSPTTS